jgi:hypothetical protein
MIIYISNILTVQKFNWFEKKNQKFYLNIFFKLAIEDLEANFLSSSCLSLARKIGDLLLLLLYSQHIK